jgi:hypothetical protein
MRSVGVGETWGAREREREKGGDTSAQRLKKRKIVYAGVQKRA